MVNLTVSLCLMFLYVFCSPENSRHRNSSSRKEKQITRRQVHLKQDKTIQLKNKTVKQTEIINSSLLF